MKSIRSIKMVPARRGSLVGVLNQSEKIKETVEHAVAQAADDLHQVNTELAKEVAVRKDIETELADTKISLAEAREDLSISQANEEESRYIALHDALTGIPNRALFEQAKVLLK